MGLKPVCSWISRRRRTHAGLRWMRSSPRSARSYGGAAIAVILTGMGQDGLRGAEILKAQGASILAQDEASSVVWGMPGAVVNAGLADCVLPLDQVVPEILRRAGSNLREPMDVLPSLNRGDQSKELQVPPGACLFSCGHCA